MTGMAATMSFVALLATRVRLILLQDHDERLVLHDDRHGGNDQVGRRAHQQIDLIDIQQLGVNSWNRRGAALIVVIDELDRPA